MGRLTLCVVAAVLATTTSGLPVPSVSQDLNLPVIHDDTVLVFPNAPTTPSVSQGEGLQIHDDIKALLFPDNATTPDNTSSMSDFRERKDMGWGTPETINGKNVHVYVITLDVNKENRYPVFRLEWEHAWPTARVSVIEGIKDDRRGFGVQGSFVNAMKQGLEDKCDICVIMEDDAGPFNETKYPEEIMIAAESTFAQGGAVSLLGGHHITIIDGDKKDHASRIQDSWGAYGWVIQPAHMPGLIKFWEDDLKEYEGNTKISPDLSWYKYFAQNGIFIATPMVVDHHDGHTTWGGEYRKELWSGNRKFWLQDDFHQVDPMVLGANL